MRRVKQLRNLQGFGLRVWGSGFRVQGLGFRVQVPGLGVESLGFGVEGLGARVLWGVYLREALHALLHDQKVVHPQEVRSGVGAHHVPPVPSRHPGQPFHLQATLVFTTSQKCEAVPRRARI